MLEALLYVVPLFPPLDSIVTPHLAPKGQRTRCHPCGNRCDGQTDRYLIFHDPDSSFTLSTQPFQTNSACPLELQPCGIVAARLRISGAVAMRFLQLSNPR
jgi:hypothetical protein